MEFVPTVHAKVNSKLVNERCFWKDFLILRCLASDENGMTKKTLLPRDLLRPLAVRDFNLVKMAALRSWSKIGISKVGYPQFDKLSMIPDMLR